MNKRIMNWGGQYESPSVATLDVLSEGVLCASTPDTFSIKNWERDEDVLNF